MNKKLNTVLLFFILFVAPVAAQVNRAALEKQLKETIADKKAEVGIAVIINGKDTLTLNNDVRYPMMSVFKFHQALSVAHYLEQKGLPLTTPIHIRKSDLKPNMSIYPTDSDIRLLYSLRIRKRVRQLQNRSLLIYPKWYIST